MDANNSSAINYDIIDNEPSISVSTLNKVQMIMYLILIPMVAVPGMIACGLSFIIFTSRKMRLSMNMYLAGLCVFDFVLLFTSAIIYPALYLCTKSHSKQACSVLPYFIITLFPIMLTAQTGSIYTCVALTVDRFLVVIFPLKSRQWCIPHRAVCTVFLVAAFSFVVRSTVFFEYKIDVNGSAQTRDFRSDPQYIVALFTQSARNLLNLLIMFLAPWISMFILNVVIVAAVHKAFRRRNSLTNNYSQAATSNATSTRTVDRERRMTIMALLIILTFLIFNLPMAGINFIEVCFDSFDDAYRKLLIYVGNFLMCLNTATNFPIYCVGPKFRQTAAMIFCGTRRRTQCGNESFSCHYTAAVNNSLRHQNRNRRNLNKSVDLSDGPTQNPFGSDCHSSAVAGTKSNYDFEMECTTLVTDLSRSAIKGARYGQKLDSSLHRRQTLSTIVVVNCSENGTAACNSPKQLVFSNGNQGGSMSQIPVPDDRVQDEKDVPGAINNNNERQKSGSMTQNVLEIL